MLQRRATPRQITLPNGEILWLVMKEQVDKMYPET